MATFGKLAVILAPIVLCSYGDDLSAEQSVETVGASSDDLSCYAKANSLARAYLRNAKLPLLEHETTPERQLAFAIGCENTDEIRKLLAEGVDPNAEVDKGTISLITFAAWVGNIEVLKQMVASGASLGDDPATTAPTPLSAALANRLRTGSDEVFLYLVEAGADLRVGGGGNDLSIVERLMMTGQYELVSMMLKRGYSYRLDFLREIFKENRAPDSDSPGYIHYESVRSMLGVQN